MIYDFKF